MKKRILVTGGAGYIGSHTVVELIQAGYEPIIIDNFDNSYPFVITRVEEITNSKIKFHKLDVNNYHDLSKLFSAEKNIDGVIHFAAHKAVGESVDDPLKYYNNNVGGLIKLLEKLVENKISNIVFSSSCTVYGEPDTSIVSEETVTKPASSPYGNTKQICEDILQDYVKASLNFKCVLLRYFNPIGAHASALIGELPTGIPNNLVPFITQTAIGKREKITVFGDNYPTADGSCIRDYIHVVDLAKAHVKALSFLFNQKENDTCCEIFNIGTGKGNSVLEVISAFENSTGVKLKYEIGPQREGDVTAVFANADKANNILNWKAKIDINQALLDSWNWEKSLNENG
jgi:UDP-glucose 4-epimerase